MFQFIQNGITYNVEDGEDLLRQMGQIRDKNIVMTDEGGNVVSVGSSVKRMIGNQPLVKALRDQETLFKAQQQDRTTQRNSFRSAPQEKLSKSIAGRRVLFSKTTGGREFSKTLLDLELMQKGLTATTVVENDSDDIDELWAKVIDMDATLNKIANYLEALVQARLLPEIPS